MLTRPTTEQILQGVAVELRDAVLADVHSEPVKVLVAQMEQMLRNVATRAAHEIAWMHEEVAAMARVTGRDLGAPASLHLDDVISWYDAASRLLSDTIDQAFADGDSARTAALKELLDARSANEMRIVGALDLVGRG